MRDVAREAGVSLKTVSRVVNSEAGVGGDTAARVAAAIDALGYRRNDLARNLRHGRTTATIGLVIADVANPFFSSIAAAVELHASARGCMLLTGSSGEDPARERQLLAAMTSRRVDGLVVVPGGDDHRYLASEQRIGTPVVFLDRPPGGIDADCVLSDHSGGARSAVRHLLRAGHRRIGIVGHETTTATAERRLQGYREAVIAAGADVDEALIRLGSHDADEAAAATTGLLSSADPPTALFTTNNRMTVGAVRALRAASRPVALVGFDDFELADLLATPVTVVAQDPAELGRRAAQLLFARLDGDGGPSRTVVVPTRLIPRGSGEVPA